MFLDCMKQWFFFYKECSIVDKKYMCVYKWKNASCGFQVFSSPSFVPHNPQSCIGQIHMLFQLKPKSNGKDILLWLLMHAIYETWLGTEPSNVKNEKSSTHQNLLQLINMIARQGTLFEGQTWEWSNCSLVCGDGSKLDQNESKGGFHTPQTYKLLHGIHRLPMKTLKVEQLAMVGYGKEPSLVVDHMHLVFATFEVFSLFSLHFYMYTHWTKIWAR